MDMFDLMSAMVRYFAGDIKERRHIGYQFRPSLYTGTGIKSSYVSVAWQEFSVRGYVYRTATYSQYLTQTR